MCWRSYQRPSKTQGAILRDSTLKLCQGYLIVVEPTVCLHLFNILVHIDEGTWMSVLCEEVKISYVNLKVLGCHGERLTLRLPPKFKEKTQKAMKSLETSRNDKLLVTIKSASIATLVALFMIPKWLESETKETLDACGTKKNAIEPTFAEPRMKCETLFAGKELPLQLI